MKHIIEKSAVFLACIIFLSVTLACCCGDSGSSSSSSSSSSSGSSYGTPSGMKSASSHIWVGTVLYNKDGSIFGTVRDFNDKHVFEDGSVGRGVSVDGVWMERDLVTSTKYVRNSEE